MLAKIEGGTVSYQHADHLSVRVTSDTSGTKVGEQGHYPFGGSWYETGVLPKQKFTSNERDTEAGTHPLDYAMYRSHSPRLGRFTSPDPVAGSILDPQSLNRYSYTRNDPINAIDPLGLSRCLVRYTLTIVTVNGQLLAAWITNIQVVFCWDSDQNERLLDRAPRDPEPRSTVQERFLKEFFEALKLAQKLECAKFLVEVAKKGILQEAEKGDRSELSPGEQTLYDSVTNPFQFATLAGGAGLAERPGENPTQGDYVTNAQASYATQEITTYAGFYAKGRKGRAQTLLHEGLHLFLNFSDQQLARAVERPAEDTSMASSNFQKELEKHCK